MTCRLALAVAALAFGARVAFAEAPVRVAAAADLAQALTEIGALYEKTSAHKPAITFGSSGLLARQLAEGAPFDVFLAASVAYVDEVVERGVCSADSKLRYARGRLAVWSSGALPATPAELAQARWKKIAIANPEHAPYGKAAIQAFSRLGVAEAVRPRLVFGENVQQALQYARSGNADVAVVAVSLVIREGRPYLPLEESLHDPIEQALVVCGKDPARLREARAFVAALRSEQGGAILRRYGFGLPASEGGRR